MFDEELDLQKELEAIIRKVENTDNILEIGAKEYVKDLLKLPKPKSKIKAAGYTHLVDSFNYKNSNKHKGEIEVGWGKYYGPFVDRGTTKIKARPHLKPTFNKNKDKYYSMMLKGIF